MTTERADHLVRRWLYLSAAAVVVAVAVGGITRLTDSGLSITEWLPISGVLPPLSEAGWEQAYQAFLAIPQAQSTHLGITLDEFQGIYWWEWFHRILARMVGLVLAVPYFVFLARGVLRPEHRVRLAFLPVLAAAQGALGWYMVKSGLDVRVSVSQYRLTAHLGMALVIFAICLWTAFGLGRGEPSKQPITPFLRRGISLALGLVTLTLLSGGFVAGLDAGLVYNTFPLMGGQVVPPGYWMSTSGWLNPFENPIAAQFHHRILALVSAAVVLAVAVAGRRPGVPEPLRDATYMAGVVITFQVGLGIATLLLRVPVTLGVLHQLTGLAVLGTLLLAAHRRPTPVALPTG